MMSEERAKVYAPSAGAVSFVQLFGSSLVLNPHLRPLIRGISQARLCARVGEAGGPEHADDISMPFRPRAPKAYRRKGRLLDHPNYQHSDPDQMSMAAWCNIRYKWLSLHAGVAIKGEDRDGLKRLFRYAARSSVAVSQLSYVTPEDPDRSARHPDRREGSASHN